MDPYRRSDSGYSTASSKSSSSSIFRTRKVPSYQKQAQQARQEEESLRKGRCQWKCPRYNLTWEVLEEFLRRRFPNETFAEFQSGDYWIFEAPREQTQHDHDEFAKLRPRPQPQPHQHRRRARSPE